MARNYLWIGFGVLADRDVVIEEDFRKIGLKVIPKAERKTGKILKDYELHYKDEKEKLKEITEVYRQIRYASDFYDKVPVRALSEETIVDMMNTDNLEVMVCTSYPDNDEKLADMEICNKRKWIKREFPNLRNRVIFIPESTALDSTTYIGDRPNRDMLKDGYFITTDESYKTVMRGPVLFVLQEALYGKTKHPLISFDEKSPNYWHNILVDKTTRKIVPAVADEPEDESAKLSI